MYTRGRVPSLFIRSYHSTADQLNSNTKQKVQPTNPPWDRISTQKHNTVLLHIYMLYIFNYTRSKSGGKKRK